MRGVVVGKYTHDHLNNDAEVVIVLIENSVIILLVIAFFDKIIHLDGQNFV